MRLRPKSVTLGDFFMGPAYLFCWMGNKFKEALAE
jgi:hypothetical protein